GLFAFGTNEVVIIGPDAGSRNQELHKNYLPQAVFMGSAGDENLPLLEGKRKDNKTMIYVCSNKTCRMPSEKTEQAMAQLQPAFK
ncbi:MAG: thioredoxin domain-containing protein, partial [Bacteroidetes bacterium]|nr:thioredoxin domain-containing protein [Bacteroidota bacterium]